MIPSPRRQPWAWAAAALAGAALLLAALTPPPGGGAATAAGRALWLALDWQPGRALAEPWRAWTAGLLHWSAAHLGMNLAGCALLGWLGVRAGLQGRRGVAALQAWALAWPLTHLALLLQPGLAHYAGLSGGLHAGVAVLAVALACGGPHRARGDRPVAVLLALGLAAKLLHESAWVGPAVRAVPGWDFALAPGAHLSGALAGLGCALLLAAGRPGAFALPPPAVLPSSAASSSA